MPVYEQTYSHYEGEYRPRSLAWTLIARRGIIQTWRKKWFRIILMFCLAPFIIMTLRIYLASNMELLNLLEFNTSAVKDILNIDEKFYHTFLLIQSFPCFLMTLFTGADLIASDRRTKALTLYLSKPITRLDYLFGKASIPCFYLYLVSMIPGLFLMFFYAFFNENWMYLWENRQIAGRIVLLSHVYIIPMIALILAISSMTRSKVSAVVMFCVISFVPDTLVNILYNLVQETWINPDYFSLFSLNTVNRQLGAVLFKQEIPYDLHWGWYVSALAVLVALCGLILNKQIRAVEVVK